MSQAPTRRVVRETRDTVFECGRPRLMMVAVHNGIVTVWPKGCRRKYVVSVAGAWERMVKAEVDAAKREKKRKRGAR